MALSRGLSLAVALVFLAGCGGSARHTVQTSVGTTATDTQAPPGGGCKDVSAPPAKARTAPKPTKRLDAAKSYDLTFETNCGSFTVRLDVKHAPATSASLVSLARHHYFERTVFHRIVPDFVIQGGDPTARGSGGPGYQTVDKPLPSARYTHGVVAMAKTQAEAPGTSGSQFFVVTAPDAGLPPDYAVVGTVSKGLSVVDRIGRLGGPDEQPTQTVEIERATVTVS